MTVTITKSDPVNVGGFGSRYLLYDDGSVYDNKKQRWVRQKLDRQGNLKVFLRDKYSGYSLYVAWLVATLFCMGKGSGILIIFLDGDRTNTCADNLKWSSQSRGLTTLWSNP